MNRRRHKRYDLKAPARFSWKASGGVSSRGRGFVRDISEAGIFVETHDAPPYGAAVQFEVCTSFLSRSGVVMQTKGKVVRVELSHQVRYGTGFAAATKKLKLHNNKADTVGPDLAEKAERILALTQWPDKMGKPN